MRLVLGSVVLYGCWQVTPPPAPPPRSHESPEVAVVQQGRLDEPREPIPLHSEWTGRYTCGQGLTGVVLTIDAQRSGEAIATFEFGPLPENPRVPTGSYKLTGHLRLAKDGTLELELVPDQWLDQPSGYVMVGVTAVSDRRHRMLSGTMDISNCGAIDVKRL